MLRRTPEVAVPPMKMLKFSDYVHSLHVPTNLNLVKILPLRGTGLIVLDPKLVFAAVDNFFGGNGRFAKIEGREFTATEQRIIHMLLKHVFADLKEAWSHVRGWTSNTSTPKSTRTSRTSSARRKSSWSPASTSSSTAVAATCTSPCRTR